MMAQKFSKFQTSGTTRSVFLLQKSNGLQTD